jgi:uncharacterized protein (TIGR00725 family)
MKRCFNLNGGEHAHPLKIGVMGSASGPQIEDPVAREKAYALGQSIAKRGHVLINGACPGLPHDALRGAQELKGFSIGISPAFSEIEHEREYKSPHNNDIMIYTGMGFMERDIINIRSADGVVIIGGGVGTLNELTIAYDEGRPIGVITGSHGISDSVPHIIEDLCHRKIPPNLVFDDDPAVLLDKLEEVIEKYPLPIHEDGRVTDAREGKRKEWECMDGVCGPNDGSEAGSRG